MPSEDPNCEKCSNRVRLLIQNMFENKSSGWQKSKKGDGKIKTKDTIENEVMKENQDKKRDSDNRGGDRRNDYNRDNRNDNYKDRRNDNSDRPVYQAKRTSTMEQSKDQGRNGDKRGGDKKGGRYNDDKPDFNRKMSTKSDRPQQDRQQRAPREPIEEENLKKVLKKYFAGYYAQPVAVESAEEDEDENEEAKESKSKKTNAAKNEPKKPDFRMIRDILDSRCFQEAGDKPVMLSDIIFLMFQAINEEREEQINLYIPEFLNDMLAPNNKRNNSVEQLTKGVDLFMIMLSDMISDAPHMPKSFFTTMVKPLLEKKMLALEKMDWCDKDVNEIYAVEGHFKLFLYLLQWQAEQLGSSSKAQDWFKSQTSLMDALSRLKRSLKENETTVDLEDLCKDVKGIEADSDFVAFFGIN